MDRTNKFLALAFGFSIVAAACAAPTVATEDDQEANASSDKKTSTKDSGASSTPTSSADSSTTTTTTDDDGGTSTGTPTDCSSSTTYDDCFSCCDAPSGGELAAADQAFGACACDADCASQCGGNFCNGSDPSAACDTCLTNTCDPKADALCTSAACMAASQCMQASSCNTKP